MLKLGSGTGSLTNHIYSRVKNPTPVVGMGATMLHWTDRSAGTVIKVHHHRHQLYVHVQGDHAVRIDKNGMSESQTYEYTPDPEGGIAVWRQHKLGSSTFWESVCFNNKTKRWNKTSGPGLTLGYRAAYHDYSF